MTIPARVAAKAFVIVALVAASCGSDIPMTAEEFARQESELGECASFDPSTIEVSDRAAGGMNMAADAGDQPMDMDAADGMDGHDESSDMDMDAADGMDSHDDDAAEGHDEPAELQPADVDLAFEIGMTDFAYDCVVSEIPTGTVVALRFVNRGAVDHEAVIGDESAQADAEVAMSEMAAGEVMHGHDVSSVSVAVGQSADILVNFDSPADLLIGCHVTGHYAAGMKTELRIAAA